MTGNRLLVVDIGGGERVAHSRGRGRSIVGGGFIPKGLLAMSESGLLGHNGGPPLDADPVEDPGALSWRSWCWRRAHKKAWKTPPREIALRRLARAEALGMTYREYTLAILERGVHL